MIKTNKSMQALLIIGGELSASDFIATEKRIEKIFSDLKFENGCLFLATHNSELNAENVTDKTDFEASRNEILINSLFRKRNISPAFAMQFFAQFNAKLFEKMQSEFDEKICAIMSEDDGRWTYRFHLVREDGLWISEDLEKFSQPILFDVFGGENDSV